MPWFWNHTKKADKRLDNGDVSEETSARWFGSLLIRFEGLEHMALEDGTCECVPWWIPL